MSYVLDTNIVSEMTKRLRNPSVQAWLDTVTGPNHYLSVLAFGEIRKGVELLRRRDPLQAGGYESWLNRLQQEFRTRILPIIAAVAEEWGRMQATRPLPIVDGLIAATARAHDRILVTRNVKDFAGLDMKTINPFDWRTA
ncbi:MAG: type II toxin-antitoxin system VapC family toxin [Nonomuraea sp.]|nr:type II toxin-antitoxin system VapC family toxin [Nonomuraea sp.]